MNLEQRASVLVHNAWERPGRGAGWGCGWQSPPGPRVEGVEGLLFLEVDQMPVSLAVGGIGSANGGPAGTAERPKPWCLHAPLGLQPSLHIWGTAQGGSLSFGLVARKKQSGT